MHMSNCVCLRTCVCVCVVCAGVLKALLRILHKLQWGCVSALSPHSHTPLLQSVSACLVSTLSFPLRLYRLWLSSRAQLADKIRACSACPVFPQYHILSLFSSLPLSKARECVSMHVSVCAYVCVCVCPYHIIGLDIKASYLQRVSQGFSGNLERT